MVGSGSLISQASTTWLGVAPVSRATVASVCSRATNRLDKLERGGLVRRSQDPNDRRGVTLTLTDSGAERLDAYIDRGAHRERQLLGGLSAGDKRQLHELLTKLVDSLDAELEG